ncbi:sensor histidine kinase [Methylovirgula sp. 4M-Z18]|uniref:sensor histidine kinase n=1 Tax=Methylovirgula sp. 4M-Z18 TaxID=2293567 RepID=UPI000E2E7CB3|nr:HAMP domain-containing sensor histidine kinase [Methylovirgula sp. 4M-Z18]RFB75525.1 sensor histidine kinase [Methylovirgula sp. 4M-Z18]
MRRLFWKFFTIIWLTMVASIGVLFAVSALFQIAPLTHVIERERQAFALNVAAQLLAHHGKDAAVAFASEAAKPPTPISLTIAQVAPVGGCVLTTDVNQREVESGGDCYRVILHRQEFGFVSEAWPRLVPWLSALLAAAVAAYWVARYLIRPVAQLRIGLSALAAGRFDIRIGDKMQGRRDEVAALAHDFDASAARLEEFQKSQQRLFHDVSHELRSPLSRLQAAIGVLHQNPAKLDVMMDRMVREVERIDGLIGEILTLARLTDRSNAGLEVQTLDVIDLLNDIVADAAFEAQARKIHVSQQGVQTFVAEVNGELIYRALENVIRNAVKYTSDGSQVSVRTRVKDDTLRIVVTDEGPGVPASELERIFQPFSRGEDAVVRGGYGLGLAITKQAVERHGGRVTASIADTGGLAVTLEISGMSGGGLQRAKN